MLTIPIDHYPGVWRLAIIVNGQMLCLGSITRGVGTVPIGVKMDITRMEPFVIPIAEMATTQWVSCAGRAVEMATQTLSLG